MVGVVPLISRLADGLDWPIPTLPADASTNSASVLIVKSPVKVDAPSAEIIEVATFPPSSLYPINTLLPEAFLALIYPPDPSCNPLLDVLFSGLSPTTTVPAKVPAPV